MINVYEGTDQAVRHVHVNLGHDIEEGVRVIKDALKADDYIGRRFSPRYLAIKLLEGDKEVQRLVTEAASNGREIIELRDKAVKKFNENHPDEDITAEIANEKYGFISGALAETMTVSENRKSTLPV